MELLAPVGVGERRADLRGHAPSASRDESGRRRPEPTGDTVDVPATAVICAVGEQIERGLYEGAGVEVDRRGTAGRNRHRASTTSGPPATAAAGPPPSSRAIADSGRPLRATWPASTSTRTPPRTSAPTSTTPSWRARARSASTWLAAPRAAAWAAPPSARSAATSAPTAPTWRSRCLASPRSRSSM